MTSEQRCFRCGSAHRLVSFQIATFGSSACTSCVRSWRAALNSMEAEAEAVRRESRTGRNATPEQVATACGHPVVRCSALPLNAKGEPADGLILTGQPFIYVGLFDNKAREQFVIGHELFEHRLARQWPEPLHDRLCQRASAALLLPRDVFFSAFWRYRMDLAALRRTNRHWSYNAIFRRILDLVPGSSMMKWRDGKPYFTDAHVDGGSGVAGTALQRAAMRGAMAGRGRVALETPRLTALAYRLPNNIVFSVALPTP